MYHRHTIAILPDIAVVANLQSLCVRALRDAENEPGPGSRSPENIKKKESGGAGPPSMGWVGAYLSALGLHFYNLRT